MKTVWPTVPRIIAIGDLHGDWNALTKCLKKAELINGKGNWIGGNTHLVQVGDILDRANRAPSARKDENSEFRIFGYLANLGIQAEQAGGRVHLVIGNHEIMNVLGDFSYVSKKGFQAFGSISNRAEALKPGSPFATFLANHATPALKIGTILFAHAGPTPNVVNKYSINGAKTAISNFLKGKTRYPDEMEDLFWTRIYSDPSQNPSKALQSLKYSLNKWKASALVVGHTVQNKINSAYGGRLWKIDTGMSAAFPGGKIQILEITLGKYFRVL